MYIIFNYLVNNLFKLFYDLLYTNFKTCINYFYRIIIECLLPVNFVVFTHPTNCHIQL